jgi:hypothetical protein
MGIKYKNTVEGNPLLQMLAPYTQTRKGEEGGGRVKGGVGGSR